MILHEVIIITFYFDTHVNFVVFIVEHLNGNILSRTDLKKGILSLRRASTSVFYVREDINYFTFLYMY